MKRFLKLLAPLTLVFAFSLATLSVGSVNALNPVGEAQKGVNATGNTQRGSSGLSSAIETVVNVLLFIIGAISVIMIIIGGLRYVISNGDQGQVTSAKNTILYAVIGFVIALLAYAIVNFVLDAFV